MRTSVLELIVCPSCRDGLQASADASEGEEILEGTLTCRGCAARYAIVGGVPRLAPEVLTADEARTVGGFGWQWNWFDDVNDAELEREQFLDWVAPLGEDAFRDRVILDAGCGMGRWPEVVASFGARAVVAVDLGDSVDAAFRRTRHLPEVHIVQGSILDLPLRRGSDADIDGAYSIGVLHHMPDPRAGFLAMQRHVRPGGFVHAWVYGAEGNEWVERIITPLREHVTAHLPKLALLGLSFGLALPVHATARLTNRAGAASLVPYGEYLTWLGQFGFRHTHHVVFDHLNPTLAAYLPRAEVEEWARLAALQDVAISARNNQSWRLVGTRPDN
ncbi:MAG TPA: methyltransferase domain-containing protein [Kofleriaceae bacterium]|nr:methyltransferase domain-containing protein [Kofleriaceae bacterium]